MTIFPYWTLTETRLLLISLHAMGNKCTTQNTKYLNGRVIV
jgi:hypothetical protein